MLSLLHLCSGYRGKWRIADPWFDVLPDSKSPAEQLNHPDHGRYHQEHTPPLPSGDINARIASGLTGPSFSNTTNWNFRLGEHPQGVKIEHIESRIINASGFPIKENLATDFPFALLDRTILVGEKSRAELAEVKRREDIPQSYSIIYKGKGKDLSDTGDLDLKFRLNVTLVTVPYPQRNETFGNSTIFTWQPCLTRTLEVFSIYSYQAFSNYIPITLPVAELQLYVPPFDAVAAAGASTVGSFEQSGIGSNYSSANDVGNGTGWNDGLTHFCTSVSPSMAPADPDEPDGILLARCDISPDLNWGCPFGIHEMRKGFVFNRHWMQPDICNRWDPDCDTLVNERVKTLGEWAENKRPDWGKYYWDKMRLEQGEEHAGHYVAKYGPGGYDFSYIP